MQRIISTPGFSPFAPASFELFLEEQFFNTHWPRHSGKKVSVKLILENLVTIRERQLNRPCPYSHQQLKEYLDHFFVMLANNCPTEHGFSVPAERLNGERPSLTSLATDPHIWITEKGSGLFRKFFFGRKIGQCLDMLHEVYSCPSFFPHISERMALELIIRMRIQQTSSGQAFFRFSYSNLRDGQFTLQVFDDKKADRALVSYNAEQKGYIVSQSIYGEIGNGNIREKRGYENFEHILQAYKKLLARPIQRDDPVILQTLEEIQKGLDAEAKIPLLAKTRRKSI